MRLLCVNMSMSHNCVSRDGGRRLISPGTDVLECADNIVSAARLLKQVPSPRCRPRMETRAQYGHPFHVEWRFDVRSLQIDDIANSDATNHHRICCQTHPHRRYHSVARPLQTHDSDVDNHWLQVTIGDPMRNFADMGGDDQ